ncbi:DNA/RNA non-specific endonuclease [Frateuria aurantia]
MQYRLTPRLKSLAATRMLPLLLLGLGLNPPAHAAFEACRALFPHQHVPTMPAGHPGKTRDLCFSDFAILYSATSRTPVYGVERLNKRNLDDHLKRTNRFYEEARLPVAERARLADYRASLGIQHFDRGHIVPAGDRSTAAGMAQSFSLANMTPQYPSFNRRTWADVERATRKYVMRAHGDVYVFTGPYYGSHPQRLGPDQVWIPDYVYKLVYDPATGRSWAFWLPNLQRVRVQPPISYAELVQRTGIHFLD